MSSLSPAGLSGVTFKTLASQAHSQAKQRRPLPSPSRAGTPLDQIKGIPASCHLQPIKASHRGRVAVPWGEGHSLSKKFNCVSGLWLRFVFVFSLKINSPWLELNFFSSLMKASQILSQEIRLKKAEQLGLAKAPRFQHSRPS